MVNIRKSFSVCIHNVRKWATNPRIYILGILLILFVYTYVNPITNFSKIMGYRVTPWAFPFISNFIYSQLVMMLGIVFLFCDAPFTDAGQPYFLIRSGRIQWGLGQVFYIMLGTALYFLFIALASILVLAPNMFFSVGWGKILGTLAQTNAGRFNNIYLPVSNQILTLYTPIQAFGLSLLLEWCAGTMLGLIIFIINMNFSRAMGVIASSAVVLLDFVIYSTFPSYMNHFSPVSMARLTTLDTSGLSPRPTNQYAYIFFAVGIILLSIIAVLSVRKRSIQVLPPV